MNNLVIFCPPYSTRANLMIKCFLSILIFHKKNKSLLAHKKIIRWKKEKR